MKCQTCRTAEATVHVTDLIGDFCTQAHLCPECAAKERLDLAPLGKVKFNCPKCGGACEAGPPEGSEPVDVTCPACGFDFKVKLGIR